MINLPLGQLLKRKKRSRIRAMLRGYRLLQEQQQLGRIRDIREALAHTPVIKGSPARFVFGAGFEHADIIVRQYLMRRTASLRMNAKLLAAIGDPSKKIIHPLPRPWIKVLRENGFRVADIRSFLYWYCFGLYVVASGFVEGLAVLIGRSGKNAATGEKKTDAFFLNLGADNLPDTSVPDSRDVFSWYASVPLRGEKQLRFYHTIAGVPDISYNDISIGNCSGYFRSVTGWKQRVHFLGWLVTAAITSIACMFCGKWWYAVMFQESVVAAVVRAKKEEQIAKTFLFHNSEWLYRPLWTYDAEQRGARIALYFYSTNIESFQSGSGPVLHMNNWSIVNWPTYYVWDSAQAEFIRQQTKREPEIQVTGPIWFTPGTHQLPVIEPVSVSVFDVTPLRMTTYVTLGAALEYFVADTSVPFLKDIYEVANALDIQVVIKQKRKMGPSVHKGYAAYVRSLAAKEGVVFADSSAYAGRIIQHTPVVISMPFTSTALIGREMGKISVYYDPRKIIQKNDPGAHGIPVISGREELEAWMRSISLTLNPTTVLK